MLMISHKNASSQLVVHGLDSRKLLTSAFDRSAVKALRTSLLSSASYNLSSISKGFKISSTCRSNIPTYPSL